MGELRKQYDRHKEMLIAPSIALEGARLAFQLHKAISLTTKNRPDDASKRISGPSTRLAAMYTLNAASRKPRQAYLRTLLGMLAIEQHDTLETKQMLGELQLCQWLCHALAEMPYDKEGDVLAIIHQANRMLSIAAEPTLAATAKLLSDEDDAAPKEPAVLLTAATDDSDGIIRAGHTCSIVALTFVLKQHLKRAYGVSDIRLQVRVQNHE